MLSLGIITKEIILVKIRGNSSWAGKKYKILVFGCLTSTSSIRLLAIKKIRVFFSCIFDNSSAFSFQKKCQVYNRTILSVNIFLFVFWKPSLWLTSGIAIWAHKFYFSNANYLEYNSVFFGWEFWHENVCVFSNEIMRLPLTWEISFNNSKDGNKGWLHRGLFFCCCGVSFVCLFWASTHER